MATTATPYGTKPGYTAGAGVPYDDPPLRYHRAHHCLNFILRVLTALATAAAIVTLLKSNETIRVPGSGIGAIRARWHDFAGFKWFILANAIVCAYAILAALASLCGVCTPRGPLSLTPLAWLTFLVDFLLASALMSAVASATTIAWIGYKGQSNAGWNAQCGVVRIFCRRVAGALIASYCGWVFLALSTLIAASAIHRLRRRAVY